MRLVLVGPRGAGKTACGRLAAGALRVSFVDIDSLVEARGRSISEIFAVEGEAGFRRVEREEILGLEPPAEAIIATGGGAVLDPDNRPRLAALGTVVWLRAAPEILAARVAGSGRPRLWGQDDLAEAQGLSEAREPLYRSLAVHSVDTGALSESEVVARLVAIYRGGEAREGSASSPRGGHEVQDAPPNAGGTRRQRLAALLREGAITLPELAEILGVPLRILVEDLEHLRRSCKDVLEIEPAQCPSCGRVFRDRIRLTRPSRCPSCRCERISWPRIRCR
ncbi:MAG: shikimate kinase [Polyangia bacterium]|jgi:shikimate kinase|nr:shikimate kinase [Polyangia bacterium]